ncbi:MAG: PEP-CTERM sorting domain-containing protein [Planctomycetota bacterium]
MLRTGFIATLALAAGTASASTTVLNQQTDIVAPSFRGDANTTYLGWDVFDEVTIQNNIPVITDLNPDLGTAGGSFITNNGADHQSSSFNYYSGGSSVDETITFDAATGPGGFTTVIVQGITLFGALGAPIQFSEINGFAPVVNEQIPFPDGNAAGKGSFFVKYEIPGSIAASSSFDIDGGSFTSFDKFTVDTQWSATGFAPDTALVPEPGSIALLGLGGLLALRRRRA